jgi:hypothetical protein
MVASLCGGTGPVPLLTSIRRSLADRQCRAVIVSMKDRHRRRGRV